MDRRIVTYDTTLRDGAQGEGVSFSVWDKLQITERLDELGIDYVEGGYPLSNPKDAEYFRRARDLTLSSVRLCAFGMTRRRGRAADQDEGMRALIEAQTPVCTVVGKTWDFHVTDVLQVPLDENLRMIEESLQFLAAEGREVIYDAEHFFDGWKANPAYALRTLRAAAAGGATWVVLCDTNGGSLPDQIVEGVTAAREALAGAGARLGIHCHNDCDLAVANTLAAVEAGVDQVQGTINGLGERCGNADLISTIAVLAFKRGYDVVRRDRLRQLTEISRFVYETANFMLRANQPFVGSSAFAHKGGMHVHAVNRAAHTYEHMPPEDVGNERRILISELSGRSNIRAGLARHGLAQDEALGKRVLAEIVALENRGYQFEAAEASFDLLVLHCSERFRRHFRRLKYHAEISARSAEHPDGDAAELLTEATVKLEVRHPDDGVWVLAHEVAEGDGPVNALDAALRKALRPLYPCLRGMRLIDYKVRVVNSEAGTAARIRVFIESRDEHDVWGTVGVSENIIEASWLALVDAFEYKLHKEDGIIQSRPAGSAPAESAAASDVS